MQIVPGQDFHTNGKALSGRKTYFESVSWSLDAGQYSDQFGHGLGYAQRTRVKKSKACRRAAVIYKRLGCRMAITRFKATRGVS